MLADSGRKIQTPYQMFEFSKSHGDGLIIKAQDWIENNYRESITLSKLEKTVNTGAKTLTRRFRKVTGVTPMAYLQKLRIETAKRLLESKNITFNEVTWEVGYNDDLTIKHPNWVKFLKIVAEQQYIELEKRIFQLQKNNALQRYGDLIKNQPDYIQNIPLQYLASYLGITQRHLSRIRREISF